MNIIEAIITILSNFEGLLEKIKNNGCGGGGENALLKLLALCIVRGDRWLLMKSQSSFSPPFILREMRDTLLKLPAVRFLVPRCFSWQLCSHSFAALCRQPLQQCWPSLTCSFTSSGPTVLSPTWNTPFVSFSRLFISAVPRCETLLLPDGHVLLEIM